MADPMARNRKRLSTPIAGALLLFWQSLAFGQAYETYPGDPYAYDRPYADQGGYYDDPYGDFDRPQRARPRRGRAGALDGGDYLPEEEPPARGARRGARLAMLPPDADPAYSTGLDYDDEVDPNVATRTMVDDPTGQPAGVITIDTGARKLYLSLGGGQAIEYGVGVGREGFAWKGTAQIGRKAFWPGWTPPKEMLLRRPDLPDHMEGGLDNPLGARALYLFKGNKDTLFRIHGTNEPDTIGKAVSSGCIRMLNADVIDLYRRVSKGARVVVR